MQKVSMNVTHRDQNLKVRDRKTVTAAFGSALLELCQTPVLTSQLLQFPADVAVPPMLGRE